MKKAVIIHCWGGNPIHCWYPKTKKELENRGYKVTVPEMPSNKLGAKLIIKHNMGHFSGPVYDPESITSLPEVTAAILQMDKK